MGVRTLLEPDDGCDDDGKPGGSGMPACFDLCAGGVLSSTAQAGSAGGEVASVDIVRDNYGVADGRVSGCDDVMFNLTFSGVGCRRVGTVLGG